MDCRRIRQNLPAYLDSELSRPDMITVEAHVADCTVCRKELDALEKTWERIARLAPIQPSPDFRARFWERVRQEDAQKDSLWGWLRVPRLVPVLGILAVWSLGVTGTLVVYGNHSHRAPTPTEQSVSIFTSPYPQNSIEHVFLKGSTTEGNHL